MNRPVIAPSRVRVDLRLLAPDCHRPARMLRSGRRASVPDHFGPDRTLEQAETGLAGMALYYRGLVAVALCMLVGPAVLAIAAFRALWIWPSNVYEPFIRGYHVPGIALYEAAAFAALFAALGVASVLATRAFAHMASAGTALLHVREEVDPDRQSQLAEELASGRWPRVQAVVSTSPDFGTLCPGTGTGAHATADEECADEPTVPEAPVRWSLIEAFAITAFAVVVLIAGGALVGVLRARVASDTAVLAVTAACLVGAYALSLVPVWVVSRRRGRSMASAVGFTRVRVSTVVRAGLAVGFSGRLIAAVWGALLGALGVHVDVSRLDPTRIVPPGGLGVTVTVVVAVLIAPLAEEIVFRGVLLTALRDHWSDAVAIGVSSAMFALIHVYWFAIPPVFALSWMLSSIFFRHRSLWVPIAAHATFNGLGVGLLYLAKAQGLL